MSQHQDAIHNNLPFPLNRFIGREHEMDEVKGLLATTRLLTLTGTGGCGKTRLALQLATDLLDEYEQGVWWVELAGLSDPHLVPQTVASALGLSEQPGRSLTDTLSDFLRPRKLLLVLDNCEHLVAACAYLVETLLHSCLYLRILTTSREALTISGETTWLVPPLHLPDAYYLPPLDGLLKYEAVQLFIERSAAVLPSFRLTAENAAAVVQICRRVDGIPLATELAAARVKSLSLEQIVARLDDAYRLLTGGSRTALPRQQTLLATMDWSYDLLSELERRVFRRLSVFAGGFTLEAAEAICAGEGVEAEEVFDVLSHLLEKSLVLVGEWSSEARYHLLETIRQYGQDKLRKAGEVAAVRRRYCDWYARFTEHAEPEIVGPQQAEWLHRLELEHDNIRTALAWSLEQGDGEPAARIGAAIWHFWLYRGYLAEGRNTLERILKHFAEQTTVRARVLLAGGLLAFYQDDYSRASVLLEESRELSRALPDRQGLGYALNALGVLARSRGDYERATTLFEESLPLLRALAETRVIALALSGWSLTALYQGDYERATALCEESLLLARERGDPQSIAGSLTTLAIILLERGDNERARTLCEESLALRRQLGDMGGIAHSLMILGRVALSQDRGEQAVLRYKESLALRQDIGDKEGIAAVLEGLATVAVAQRHPVSAARLAGAAEILRETIGAPLPSIERPAHERTVAAIRIQLDQAAFTQAWAAGRALPLEQAIMATEQINGREQTPATAPTIPTEEVPAVTRNAKSRGNSYSLTDREREVLQLVARGLTDSQIAEKLVISPRTVEAHARSIYSKLGVSSRAAATRSAIAHQLVSLDSDH